MNKLKNRNNYINLKKTSPKNSVTLFNGLGRRDRVEINLKLHGFNCSNLNYRNKNDSA